MCTVTWHQDGTRYDVLFNRDESRTRAAAEGPGVQHLDGTACLMPVDGQAGGTWMGVNEFGLTLAILNFYDAATSPLPASPISRGLLVRDLLSSGHLGQVEKRLRACDLGRYAPYLLLGFQPDRPVESWHWNGAALRLGNLDDHEQPVVTSAVRTDEVRRSRKALFADLGCADPGTRTPETLMRFHESRRPEPGALSVCMERDDAHTVSFSRAHVDPDRVVYHYLPVAPCFATPGDWHRAELSRAPCPAST